MVSGLRLADFGTAQRKVMGRVFLPNALLAGLDQIIPF